MHTAIPTWQLHRQGLVSLLAETLGVPRDSLTLVSGHSARDKIVELAGLAPAVAEGRLASASATARIRKDSR